MDKELYYCWLHAVDVCVCVCVYVYACVWPTPQLLVLGRVTVSNPVIKPADLLEVGRLSSVDSKANILHGESRNHYAQLREHRAHRITKNAIEAALQYNDNKGFFYFQFY